MLRHVSSFSNTAKLGSLTLNNQPYQQEKLTGVLHGRAHHQEGDADADGDEDLDQLGHPGIRPVTFINNLHGSVGRGDE